MMASVALFFSFLISQACAVPSLSVNVLIISATANAPLTAKTTLENNGDTVLKLFNDPRSVLAKFKHSGVPSTIFKITKQGGGSRPCKPYFKGPSVIFDLLKAVKSTNPLDFTVLKPGQTIKAEYDLQRSYGFSQCGAGSYNIKAFTTFYHVEDSGASKAIEASTHMRQFQLDSASITRASEQTTSHRKARSIGKRDLYFEGCADDQRFWITRAAMIADEMVQYAQGELDVNLAKKAKSRYQTWFGNYDQSRHDTVKQHFSNLYKKATTSTFGCRPCPFKYTWANAYVRPAQMSPRKIYLCKSFWTLPMHTTDSKPGLFIEALSRLPISGKTPGSYTGRATDHYITLAEVQGLTARNPEGAVRNAENYRRFAETYFSTLGHKMKSDEESDEEEPDVTSSLSVTAGQATSRPGGTPPRLDSFRIDKGKAKIPGSM